MRAIVTLLVGIISALVGLVAILAGRLWSLQPTCAGCGVNIGAGILGLLGWAWMGISLIVVATVLVWMIVRASRSRSKTQSLRESRWANASVAATSNMSWLRQGAQSAIYT